MSDGPAGISPPRAAAALPRSPALLATGALLSAGLAAAFWVRAPVIHQSFVELRLVETPAPPSPPGVAPADPAGRSAHAAEVVSILSGDAARRAGVDAEQIQVLARGARSVFVLAHDPDPERAAAAAAVVVAEGVESCKRVARRLADVERSALERHRSVVETRVSSLLESHRKALTGDADEAALLDARLRHELALRSLQEVDARLDALGARTEDDGPPWVVVTEARPDQHRAVRRPDVVAMLASLLPVAGAVAFIVVRDGRRG